MNKRLKLPLVSSANSVQLERERLNSLINSMGDGVVAIDENFKIVVANGAMQNILDVNSSLRGRSISNVLNLVDKNDQPLDVRELIQDVKISNTSRDWRLIYPDGEKINLYVSIAPVRLGYGQRGQKGYVILLRDITREKSLEEERDEFISVVSHELRTPIAIAEGNLSNAQFIFKKSGIKNESILETLQEAYRQITFLSGMINDLAMLSRAERGKLNIDIEPINVNELINELASSYKQKAADKNLTIKTEIDNSLELLQSGRLYVHEILQNFITNAIKYTDVGHVVIGAKQKQKGVQFFVIDTGHGISKTDQQKLFDKFFRSENFRTRETNGTGIGLYVTMKLARLLHAEISVESELEIGSTFAIFVPNLA